MSRKPFWALATVASALLFGGSEFVQAQTTTAPTTGSIPSGLGTGGSFGGFGGGGQGLGALNANNASVNATTIKGPTSSFSQDKSIGPSYVNWMSLGNPANYSTTGSPTESANKGASFGTVLYKTTNTTSASSAATKTTNQNNGFTTQGVPRAPYYSTVLSEDLPLVKHKVDVLQSELASVVERSTFLKSKATVKTNVIAGGIVLITGQVGTEREKKQAEGIIRMTPGVRNVVNELQVLQAKQ